MEGRRVGAMIESSKIRRSNIHDRGSPPEACPPTAFRRADEPSAQRIEDQGSRIEDQGSRIEDQGSRIAQVNSHYEFLGELGEACPPQRPVRTALPGGHSRAGLSDLTEVQL